jgi:hypothetical protein
VCDKLGKRWKETIAVYFKVPTYFLYGVTENNNEKSVRITGHRTENLTPELSNARQKC